MNDSNSRNNNFQGFENSQMDMRGNSQMDMRGFVWIGQRFLSHDKWRVKLLSDFSYFTFTNDSNSRNNNS